MIKRHSILTAILLCFVAFTQVMAQEMQEPEPLPIDPKVRYGKLSNGLTYYIRHNDQPKDRADFYHRPKRRLHLRGRESTRFGSLLGTYGIRRQ